MSARDCPIDGCQTKIKRHLAMCRTHWYEVPKPLRDRVWATYRESAGSAAHLQALEDAIAAVEGRRPEELFA